MFFLGIYTGIALLVFLVLLFLSVTEAFGLIGLVVSVLASVFWLPVFIIGGSSILFIVLREIRRDNDRIREKYSIPEEDKEYR